MEKNCGNCSHWDERNKSMQSNGTYFAKCLWELHESQMPESLLHQEIHTAHMNENEGDDCPTFKERK